MEAVRLHSGFYTFTVQSSYAFIYTVDLELEKQLAFYHFSECTPIACIHIEHDS